ncbi:dopa decarboxylase [Coemansia spiralis]|nr:dopa decarboxylase [Coemansia spiralis]
MDTAEFRKYGKEMVDIIADYYENVNNMPPKSTVKPGYLYKLMPREIPEDPNIETKIMPGMTHWQSGNFFGWFPSTNSFPSMLGDMCTNMFDIVGFNWTCSPAATELETVVMDWLGKLIGLNKRFLSFSEDGTEAAGGGVILGSAKEAERMKSRFVVYGSDQTHFATQKDARIVGCKMHAVVSDENFRLTKEALEAAIEEDKNAGLVPFFVCGTFGTTNTTAIDDLPGIADVAALENMWFHVDAAYAGAALACPEFWPLAVGIEHADSFSFSPHRWMLTSLNMTTMWVANSMHFLNSLGMSCEYFLRVKGDRAFVRDYCDWQLSLGRRFRALKLWFVLRMHGASGIQKHIRTHVSQAKWLEDQLLADGRFEMMAPTLFGLVVFRIRPQIPIDSSMKPGTSNNSLDRVNAATVELL